MMRSLSLAVLIVSPESARPESKLRRRLELIQGVMLRKDIICLLLLLLLGREKGGSPVALKL